MFEEESELEKYLSGMVKQQDKHIEELVKEEFGIDAFDKFGRVNEDALQMLSNFYRLKKTTSPLCLDSQSPTCTVATIEVNYEFEPVLNNFFVVVGNCIFDKYLDNKALFYVFHVDDSPTDIEDLEGQGRTFGSASIIARDLGGMVMGKINNQLVPVWKWREKFKEVTGRESIA